MGRNLKRRTTMSAFNIVRTDNVLRIGFGAPASNDQIVKDAVTRLSEMDANNELSGGGVILLNGPASLPVACAIAHAIAHRFSAVGVFDPKLNGYVVAVTHDPAVELGSIIAA
jgi:CRISPR-associated protein Csx3